MRFLHRQTKARNELLRSSVAVQRQEWVAENGTLWAQVAREEKKRLTERNVAIFEIAEAASAQQAAEDKVYLYTLISASSVIRL